MPAAAVIPAPIVYAKIVAVEKLVVGSRLSAGGPSQGVYCWSVSYHWFSAGALNRVSAVAGKFTLKKLECLKQAVCLYIDAWNNRIRPRNYLLVFGNEVMIKRDRRGHPYSAVRGEILGSAEDELLRKHLPRMFSLIKSESQRFEDDQIPS